MNYLKWNPSQVFFQDFWRPLLLFCRIPFIGCFCFYNILYDIICFSVVCSSAWNHQKRKIFYKFFFRFLTTSAVSSYFAKQLLMTALFFLWHILWRHSSSATVAKGQISCMQSSYPLLWYYIVIQAICDF